jgi:hypothetical protein
MNTRAIPSADMQIGSRRREPSGDINVLGASMAHDDLRHSMVVDDQLTLIA